MDIFNELIENYGGRQMQRIFKSYLILSLIIKQLLFSLFFSPSNPEEIKQQTNGVEIYNDFSIQGSENKIDESSRLIFLFDLLNPKAEEITAVQEL